MKIILFVLSLSLMPAVFAQDKAQNPDYQKMHEDLLRSLREGNSDFESRLEEMMKRFGAMDESLFEDMDKMFENQGSLIDQFFQGGGLRRLLEEGGAFGNLEQGDFEWLETPKSRILVAKLKLDDQTPLDIEIKNGQITFKGESRIEEVNESAFGTSRSIRVQNFNRSFAVPTDVDADQAKFENEDGKILVTFPKFKEGPVTPEKAKPLEPGSIPGERKS